MESWSDSVALVTGAGSGVGRALARALGRRGAVLLLNGRRVEPLEQLAEEHAARGGAAHVLAGDLTVDSNVERLAAHVRERHARLDVLVHGAGLLRIGETEVAAVDDFDRQYEINARAPWLLTRALLPALRAGRGQIVFVNSSAGLAAKGGVGPYSASKHALKALAESLRNEVNPIGIRVMSVFLGRTATPMQAELHRLEGRPYRPERLLQPEDVAAIVLGALELPRTAEVTDIHVRPMMKLEDG